MDPPIRSVGIRTNDVDITVGLLLHHPLVAKYVQGIVCKDGTISAWIKDKVDQDHGSCPCPNIIILDAGTTRLGLGEYISPLKLAFPTARTLVLGQSAPDDAICDLLSMGVDGFVSYDDIENELIPAVRKLSEGHLAVSSRVLELFVLNRSSRGKIRPKATFTRQETLALRLLTQKMSNKEIAFALKITERTVKFHLANIFSKLGVNDRGAAANAALCVGVLADNDAGQSLTGRSEIPLRHYPATARLLRSE
jgi:two-component system NarL family response regulator